MYQGILAVWKPRGMTSHDIVFKLRKILHMRRIGHTGTLDPQVDGVLVICLGQATKLVQLLMESNKEYYGEITLGYSTETEDSEGEIIERKPVDEEISLEFIDKEMATFQGCIQQVPPMYSAVKVKGKRLYEYARAGEPVDRPQRWVSVDTFERLSDPMYDSDLATVSWDFRVVCGKGTYVRTLAVDLGKALGYPAHMSQLTRTATSGFNAEQALKLEEIEKLHELAELNKYIQPIESGLKKLASHSLNSQDYQKVKHGQVLDMDYFGFPVYELLVLYYEQKAVAVYQPHPNKPDLIKPLIMFR